jgi:thiol:disulfide interchange protein DsbC
MDVIVNAIQQVVSNFMRVPLLTGLATTAAGLAVMTVFLVGDFAEADAVPEQYQFVQDAFPDVDITSVQPSPIPGLLQMAVGADIYYVSENGEYFIMGDIFGLESKDNLTENARNLARASYLNEVGENDGVIFAASDEKYVVTIFTDVDCGYCRKLHREMSAYNDRGISIRYLFFPRTGPGTPSWAKADAVWCADSRNEALTAAKNGVAVEADDCDDTPVAEHYQLGKDLGIVGTPAIFRPDCLLICGYHSPDDFLGLLQETT